MANQTKAQKTIDNHARTKKATAARVADPSLLVVRLPANVKPKVAKWWAGLKPAERGKVIEQVFESLNLKADQTRI